MDQERNYSIPDGAQIGHVHLKVSDLERSLRFYCDLLGFKITMRYGTDAAFISAGGYHHHIGLNVWFSKNGSPAPKNSTGLFHTAIVYPTRKSLAEILHRLQSKEYRINGASDHGVSEAIYLDDPDENGVELYWDKPIEKWPKQEDGSLDMWTRVLDTEDLLSELD
ncbi:MAG: glyoxalase [Fluviicola sp.]|nr:MAG: glyoxalase [Fluviicola sp.]